MIAGGRQFEVNFQILIAFVNACWHSDDHALPDFNSWFIWNGNGAELEINFTYVLIISYSVYMKGSNIECIAIVAIQLSVVGFLVAGVFQIAFLQ